VSRRATNHRANDEREEQDGATVSGFHRDFNINVTAAMTQMMMAKDTVIPVGTELANQPVLAAIILRGNGLCGS